MRPWQSSSNAITRLLRDGDKGGWWDYIDGLRSRLIGRWVMLVMYSNVKQFMWTWSGCSLLLRRSKGCATSFEESNWSFFTHPKDLYTILTNLHHMIFVNGKGWKSKPIRLLDKLIVHKQFCTVALPFGFWLQLSQNSVWRRPFSSHEWCSKEWWRCQGERVWLGAVTVGISFQ